MYPVAPVTKHKAGLPKEFLRSGRPWLTDAFMALDYAVSFNGNNFALLPFIGRGQVDDHHFGRL
jgi:hypothetical protein